MELAKEHILALGFTKEQIKSNHKISLEEVIRFMKLHHELCTNKNQEFKKDKDPAKKTDKCDYCLNHGAVINGAGHILCENHLYLY